MWLHHRGVFKREYEKKNSKKSIKHFVLKLTLLTYLQNTREDCFILIIFNGVLTIARAGGGPVITHKNIKYMYITAVKPFKTTFYVVFFFSDAIVILCPYTKFVGLIFFPF